MSREGATGSGQRAAGAGQLARKDLLLPAACCPLPLVPRVEIVAVARGWIGTPYHHQASKRGVGADCLGLVRGVWRELYGIASDEPPRYSRDWAEASGEETLLAGARRHLIEIERADIRPGDVLVFRLRPTVPAKHVGVMVTDTAMVHAMEGAAASEVSLSPWWRRRIAAAFSFPRISG